MRVPTYDHTELYRELKGALTEAFERVMSSGQLDWGEETPAFERAFAAQLELPHAVSTNSGTAAMKVALLALGIGPGDEVITVPNTDISTTAAIHHVGAKAIWVDVSPETMNMNPELTEAAITARTKALLPVHLYGHPADMVTLMDIAKRHQLAVIEDACLALGAAIGNTKVGHWGDVTCFSFAPSKHLGSYGSGGMAVTGDARLARKMEAYVAYGQAREKHYHKGLAAQGLAHQVEGLNERLDELQAALLQVKLPYLESWLAQRRMLAQRYHQAFEGCAMALPVEQPGYRHAYRNYVVHTPQRAQLQEHLATNGIATSLLYSPPLHLQPAYAARGFKPGSFPVTEAAATRQLSLPMRPNLTLEQQDYVIDKVLEVAATQSG